MQLSQTHTKILQAASPGRDPHVFVSDITGLYFYVLLCGSPHTQYRGTMLQQGL